MYEIQARIVVESATVRLGEQDLAALSLAYRPLRELYKRCDAAGNGNNAWGLSLNAMLPVGELMDALEPVLDLLKQVSELWNWDYGLIQPPLLQKLRLEAPLETSEEMEAEVITPSSPSSTVEVSPSPEQKEALGKAILEDRDWLHQKYVVEGLGSVRLGKLVGCSHSYVLKWVRIHGLQVKAKKGFEPEPDPPVGQPT